MHRSWKQDLQPPSTHLWAVRGRVLPEVEAGLVGQPEGLLQQVPGEVLEGQSQHAVAHLSVLLAAVLAEVDEILDVEVGTNVGKLLAKTESEDLWGLPGKAPGKPAPTSSSFMMRIPTSRCSTWSTSACSAAPSCPAEQRVVSGGAD